MLRWFAELRDGMLVPAGLVQFGLGGKVLWPRLAGLRDGPSNRSGLVPVRPKLVAAVKYFGRYRTGSWIRDGVLLLIGWARSGGRAIGLCRPLRTY